MRSITITAGMIFCSLFISGCGTSEDWKSRWNEDTAALTKELKDVDQKLTEETKKRIDAENKASRLEQENEGLRKQLESAKR
jgi:hypothetical protein